MEELEKQRLIQKMLEQEEKDINNFHKFTEQLLKKKTMENYSYETGLLLGKMIFKKMVLVDVTNSFRNNENFIHLNADEVNSLTKLESYYEKTKKNEDWNKILKFHKELEFKYLPHTISEYIDIEEEVNIDDFREGVINYLWDTDFCPYSLKNENIKIEVKNDIIEVELKLDEEPNYL